MILIIDNYDSFVFNLARYVRELGETTSVIRNDAMSMDAALALNPDGIIISPGPCGPAQAGISTPIAAQAIKNHTPLLGVCLGHQCVVAACGGTVGRAGAPVHGRASPVTHDGQGLLETLPSPLTVGRYHSLVATGAIPPELRVTARLADDPSTVMAVEHKAAPVFGVQFHPESVLTDKGHDLLGNFLKVTRSRFAGAAQ